MLFCAPHFSVLYSTFWLDSTLIVCGCQGDDRDEQEVGRGETDVVDAVTDADESAAGTADGADQ